VSLSTVWWSLGGTLEITQPGAGRRKPYGQSDGCTPGVDPGRSVEHISVRGLEAMTGARCNWIGARPVPDYGGLAAGALHAKATVFLYDSFARSLGVRL
jgi:hypothetical protein